ncbi:cysteine hydrolase [bacterium]|nr:cysteine hydrolase [bacterium]
MSELELPVRRAALLLVELQNDIVHESNVGAPGFRGILAAQVQKRGVLGKAQALAAAARAAAVPVGYVNYARKPDFPRPRTLLHRRTGATPTLIEGTWGAQTHAAVTPDERDFVFTRSIGIDGSYGTQLYPVMRMLGRDALLVCGVSTNLAVEGLVRASVNRGFEMFVIEDCCAGFPDAWHDFSVTNILPLLSTVTSSTAVLAALQAASV